MFHKTVLFFLLLSVILVALGFAWVCIAASFTLPSWLAMLMGLLSLAVARKVEYSNINRSTHV